MEPTPRRAVRVLLVNDQPAVLMFRGCDPAEPEILYWFTPGGGIDEGESAEEAVVRELFEETGFRLPLGAVGEPVHHDVTEFSFDGVAFRQQQEFYLVRVGQWSGVDTAGFDDYEAATVDQHRWWTVTELQETDEIWYPRDLVDVLKRLGID